jgi:hypothetical protein
METPNDLTNHHHLQPVVLRHHPRHHKRTHVYNDADVLFAGRTTFTDYYTMLSRSPAAYVQHQYPADATLSSYQDVHADEVISDRLLPSSVSNHHRTPVKVYDDMSSSAGSGNEDRTGSEISEPDALSTQRGVCLGQDVDSGSVAGGCGNKLDVSPTGDASGTNSHHSVSSKQGHHRPEHRQVSGAWNWDDCCECCHTSYDM